MALVQWHTAGWRVFPRPVTPLVGSRYLHTPEQAAFDEQREACYETVDCALDMAEPDQ